MIYFPFTANLLPLRKLTGANARITTNANEIFRRLELHHGISRHVAGDRLHVIKADELRGPADNVIFDMTGNMFDPATGQWLGSLTER